MSGHCPVDVDGRFSILNFNPIPPGLKSHNIIMTTQREHHRFAFAVSVHISLTLNLATKICPTTQSKFTAPLSSTRSIYNTPLSPIFDPAVLS
jgi:hypothetical protein